ncbi:MAG: hypothetical protein KJO55_09710, partial [Gammaproteobacteria bacterium]|nr:hypothetical protein [Gammaproteobacteria bacterium]
PKLIASYGLDALQAANAKTKTPTKAAVQAFLRKVSNANATSHKALGMGRDIRIDGQQLVGGALAVDDRLVHLSAFAVNDDGSKGGPRSRSRLMSVGQRRHNRRH